MKKLKILNRKREKIHVGDVLEHTDFDLRVVVIDVDENENFQGIKILRNADSAIVCKAVYGNKGPHWKKTGQHYDLEEIFQEVQDCECSK